MIPSNFQVEIFYKNLGKNFPPGGLTPKFFSKSIDSSTRAMCLHNFIAISQKLWPVGRDKVRADKHANKMTNSSMPAKTGSPWLSSMYRWIELVAHNFPPETVSLHHFRFFALRLKNRRFCGNLGPDKNIKMPISETEYGALIIILEPGCGCKQPAGVHLRESAAARSKTLAKI